MRDQVYLAAEDALGLAFGRRLLREWPVLHVCGEKDGQGFGNLRRDASKYGRMAQNGVPVLLILGGSSRSPFGVGTRALAERMAHAEILVIEGAAHAAHHTHLSEFVAAVEAFLDG